MKRYYLLLEPVVEGRVPELLIFAAVGSQAKIAVPVEIAPDGSISNMSELLTLREAVPEGYKLSSELYTYSGTSTAVSAASVYNMNRMALAAHGKAIKFEALTQLDKIKKGESFDELKLHNSITNVLAEFRRTIKAFNVFDNDFIRLFNRLKYVV